MAKNLELRGIGGSDVAAILGVDPRRDAWAVWAEMTGRAERRPATPRMRLGKFFERGIIDYYAALTGRDVEFVDETRRVEGREWMVWTPDALCRGELRGVDAKLVSWDQRFLWGETAEDIPARVQLQCDWYMAAADYPAWDVAALLDMDEPRIYTVERDLEIEREMLDRTEEFWRRYIIGNEEPQPGSSPETTRIIKERFPRQKLAMRDATEAESGLLDEYALVRSDEEDITAERTRLENTIKLAIGEGDGLTWLRGKFTWRNARGSVKVNHEALAESLMRGMAEDEKTALRREYSETKPGVRRIHFHCNQAAQPAKETACQQA